MENTKTEQLHLRVTPSEKEKLRKRAFDSNMTLSEYIVAISEDKPIVSKIELNSLITAINRIGVSINQIARIGNSQKFLKREQLDIIQNKENEILNQLADIVQKVRTV